MQRGGMGHIYGAWHGPWHGSWHHLEEVRVALAATMPSKPMPFATYNNAHETYLHP